MKKMEWNYAVGTYNSIITDGFLQVITRIRFLLCSSLFPPVSNRKPPSRLSITFIAVNVAGRIYLTLYNHTLNGAVLRFVCE